MNKYVEISIIPYFLLWIGYSYIGEYRMFAIGIIPFICFMIYILIDIPISKIELINLDVIK